jgi:hypothetical protein
VDRVRQHAFAIKRELDELAKLAGDDSALRQGVASFVGEAFFNIVRMISESATSIPTAKDDSPHAGISVEPNEDVIDQAHIFA